MKLIALVTEPSSVARFLRHLREPTEAPTMAPARDPPNFRTRAVRRALGELDPLPSEEQTQAEPSCSERGLCVAAGRTRLFRR